MTTRRIGCSFISARSRPDGPLLRARTLPGMEEIGLFPLGLVLLPTEHIPLHIFEPRYRELIGECIERDTTFGLLLEDADGMRRVGTETAIVQVLERFEDGRLNILVEGRERFRLLELTSGRSFQTGTVEPVEDGPREVEPELAARALESLRELAAVAGSEVEEPEPDSPQLSFEIAARVELDATVKQELLELTSEPERLETLAGLLDEIAQSVAAAKAVAEIASRNGKVHRPPELPGRGPGA